MLHALLNRTEQETDFDICYEVIHDWPKLAWAAEISPGSKRVNVTCGHGVERRKHWFCEAVWDGPFESGDFDQTDIVAGSGGRCRNGEFVFVSSGSMLDRLQYVRFAGGWLVSNSLVALAALTGASVNPSNASIRSDFGSIGRGLTGYIDHVPTDRGDIQLTYFDNLSWNGATIAQQAKPNPERDFSDFEKYVGFMQQSMNRVVANAGDNHRAKVVNPMVTMSGGYDSPAIAVLARNAGVEEAVSIERDREGRLDNGRDISTLLGIRNTSYPREHWRSLDRPEVRFIAGSGTAAEAAFASMAEQLDGGLLFTGFWGGVWNAARKGQKANLSDHDGSGLCLTEARLHMNFIHCPVPFWGGRQSDDIMNIRFQPEMAQWKVGGDYDKPICRRILETAGVPRQWFGTEKKGASENVFGAKAFMTAGSTADYRRWLQENRSAWVRQGKFPPLPLLGSMLDYGILKVVIPALQKCVIPALRRLGLLCGNARLVDNAEKVRHMAHRLATVPLHMRRYVFGWALEEAKRLYGPPIGSSNDPVY